MRVGEPGLGGRHETIRHERAPVARKQADDRGLPSIVPGQRSEPSGNSSGAEHKWPMATSAARQADLVPRSAQFRQSWCSPLSISPTAIALLLVPRSIPTLKRAFMVEVVLVARYRRFLARRGQSCSRCLFQFRPPPERLPEAGCRAPQNARQVHRIRLPTVMDEHSRERRRAADLAHQSVFVRLIASGDLHCHPLALCAHRRNPEVLRVGRPCIPHAPRARLPICASPHCVDVVHKDITRSRKCPCRRRDECCLSGQDGRPLTRTYRSGASRGGDVDAVLTKGDC